MWPFGRERAGSTDAAWDGKWSISEGEYEGRRMVVRRNESAAGLAAGQFPVRVGVAVPFQRPDVNGMPTPQEFSRLGAIENELVERLQASKRAVAVLTVTTRGMREFVFYACDAASAMAVIDEYRSTVSDYELQSYAAADPEWTVYRELRPRQSGWGRRTRG